MKNFKKILALLIAIIMVIPAIPVIASANDTAEVEYMTLKPENETYVNDLAGWLNSVKDENGVYVIDSKDDLIYFMLCGQVTTLYIDTDKKIDGRFAKKTFRLDCDITLNEGESTSEGFIPAESQNGVIYTWTPWWGRSTVVDWQGFRGTFDGNGHTIKGLVIYETEKGSSVADAVGFFKLLGRGAKVENIYFNNTYVYGYRRVGAIAGALAHNSDTVTLNGVGVDGFVKGNASVGGLIGATSASPVDDKETTPDVDESLLNANIETYTGNIVIENCSFNGKVQADDSLVGGFMSATCKNPIEIKNSVCSAEVVCAKGADSGQLRYGAGGFIGFAEATTTMENCQFYGKVTPDSKAVAWGAAFANVADISHHASAYAKWEEKDIEDPSTPYKATFIDCYYLSDSANTAIGLKKTQTWYEVTTKLGAETKTVTSTEYGDATSQLNAGKLASGLIEKFNIAAGDATVIGLEGVQPGNDYNARFVSYISDKTGITAVGYEVIQLDDFIAGNASKTATCTKAYKTLANNFGTGEMTASGDGYYVALAICGVQQDADYDGSAQTIMVRNKIVLNDVEQYSQWMAVTFVNGKVIGCAYVG